MLLLIHCLLVVPNVCVLFCIWSLFCYAVLSVLSSFAIISFGEERDGCLKITLNVTGLLVLCVSSSRCNLLVCSV